MLTLADDIESRSRLLFHRSTAEQAALPPARPTDQHVAVVIPFRSSVDTPLRTANLRAVVTALEHQQMPRDQYSITVVEEASETTVPDDILARIDTSIQIPYTGPFNKALALNAGVAPAPADAVLCLLDGDIFPDGHFLARNASRVATRPDLAHLPYSDMFCLLPHDSARIRRGEQPGEASRNGYVITHPPGGCVFLTAALYRTVGGFDERFVGWGGEDRDFINRIEAHTEIRRHPELLTHLHHERPNMRSDRDEIMTTATTAAETHAS
ncbi:galactosyltransferase-related protein [Curtobacterium flaccumfaciens]|nr:galactosyltransferase-related protein [Curtobacterium flaccumfaciens]